MIHGDDARKQSKIVMALYINAQYCLTEEFNILDSYFFYNFPKLRELMIEF